MNGKNSSVAIYKFRSRTEVSKLTVFFHSTKRERKHKVSHNGETPELVNLCRTKYKIEEDIEDKKDEEATVHRAGSAKVVTALEGGEESDDDDDESNTIHTHEDSDGAAFAKAFEAEDIQPTENQIQALPKQLTAESAIPSDAQTPESESGAADAKKKELSAVPSSPWLGSNARLHTMKVGRLAYVISSEGCELIQFLDVEGGKIRIILDAANCRVISDTKAATHALYREAIIEKNEYKVLFDGAKSQRRARAWAANLFA